MSEDIILSLKNVSLTYKVRQALFRYSEFNALNNISFDIKKGETLGIVGDNGCGKSSLLKVIAGIYKADSGQVIRNCESVTLLSLGLGFDLELTGRDNAVLSAMLLGRTRKEAVDSLEEICQFSELAEFIEQPVKTYSSGMRARLGFSVAITLKTDLLLIDEALSVGDANFRLKAERVMLDKINSDQTVVFVSHSANQVRKLCQRAVLLEKGRVKLVDETSNVFESYNKK